MRVGANNRLISIGIVCLLVIGGFIGLMNFGSEDAQSDTLVGGTISPPGETWDLAGSPYIVISDVTISSGSTLIIEPGVEVKFDGYYCIYVDGTLMAIGTQINRIKITSNMTVPNPGNWDRIKINPTGHAEIKYCDISYGTFGIYLESSSNNTITGNNVSLNSINGIHLWESSNNNIITNNTVSNNMRGIGLWDSSHNNITHNNISKNSRGINLESSSNNTITGNNVSLSNEKGINLQLSSNNNIITNNNISMNIGYGINHHSSSNNTITGNNFVNNGIFLQGSQLSHFNTHEIPTNNTVNGKPLYYHKNCSGININGIPVGQLILVNCSSIKVRNLKINNTDLGIEVAYSTNITITDCNVSSNNMYGIYLWESSNNNITGNDVSSNNHGYGVFGYGVHLERSDGNNITGNNVSDHMCGIYLKDSNGNNITYNNPSNNLNGIHLHFSGWDTVTGNTMIEDGIVIWGDQIEHWDTHSIDTTNTVNGKPVHYWKNQTSGIIPLGAGEVILANCTNVRIENQEINGGSDGIQLGFSSYNYITNNTVSSNNRYGIYLYYSDKNNITNNEVSNNGDGIRLHYSDENNITDNIISNNGCGIFLYYTSENNVIGNIVVSNSHTGISLSFTSGSNVIGNIVSNNGVGLRLRSSSSNNRIYHNNIINNTNQAYDEQSDNYWDNGYPSGGNFWSDYDEASEGAYDDYKGQDQDAVGSDGIVDKGSGAGGGKNPYVIDADSQDNYPLMEPCELIDFIVLKQGWNLISIPLIQEEQNLTRVLDPISGCYDTVEWYNTTDASDHWKINKVGKPFGNDLSEINETMGFWIHITQPGKTIFLYNGTTPTQNQNITLHPGWNLVGYPSLSNKNRTEAMTAINFGSDVDSIWTFNATTQRWKELGPSDYFELGRGYWIHAKIKCVWEVPL